MSFSSQSQCRNIFSSTRHSEHAMFKECSIEYYGKVVGFTKPSETQFGGNLIAALRLLCLKKALLMCIRKPKFVKKRKHRDVVLVLRRNVFGTMSLLFAKLSILLCD